MEGGWIGAAGWVREKCVEVGPLQAVGEYGGGCGCPASQPSGALRGPLKVVVLRRWRSVGMAPCPLLVGGTGQAELVGLIGWARDRRVAPGAKQPDSPRLLRPHA